MTIKELKKLFPNEKQWMAQRVLNDETKFMSFNYNDDDIVEEYQIKDVESEDITGLVFGGKNKGKIIINKERQVWLWWKKK